MFLFSEMNMDPSGGVHVARQVQIFRKTGTMVVRLNSDCTHRSEYLARRLCPHRAMLQYDG
jgi:hypothetical protein